MPASGLHLSRINFQTLKLFCAIAETGTLSQAAQRCHLTVSAASRRLAELEIALNNLLFERSAQGLLLTSAGHVALQHALRLSQGSDQMHQELHDHAAGFRGHVRLWANMSSLNEFLPQCLSSFSHQNPNIQLELEEQLSVDTLQAVERGMVDLGVVAGQINSIDLVKTPLYSDTLILVCSPDHPLSNKGALRFKETLAYDFVGLNTGSALLQLALSAAEHLQSTLKLRIQVRSFDVLCKMVKAGMGIGLVPIGACAGSIESHQLVTVQLEEDWALRALYLVSRPLPQLSPAAHLLRQHLLQQVPSLAQQAHANYWVPQGTPRQNNAGD